MNVALSSADTSRTIFIGTRYQGGNREMDEINEIVVYDGHTFN